jgi:hypothetical protein
MDRAVEGIRMNANFKSALGVIRPMRGHGGGGDFMAKGA